MHSQHQLKGRTAEDICPVQEQVRIMTDKHHVYLTQVMIALLRLSVVLSSSSRLHAICGSKCAATEFHALWVAAMLLVCRPPASHCV